MGGLQIFAILTTHISKITTNKYPPWNNEPAPFGSLSAIFLGKIFWGTKKILFLGGKNFFGEKMSFFEKKMKKNFLEKFREKKFFFDFFNIIVPYFDSNRFFSGKITIL